MRKSVAWRLTEDGKSSLIRQSFVGGRAVDPVGMRRQDSSYSWFTGSRSQWRTGVHGFSAIRYEDVWPGIDIVYSGNGSVVKYRFEVRRGADPTSIAIAYEGADITLVDEGDLRLDTPVGAFTDRAPTARQGETPVSVRYSVRPDRSVGFELGRYDRRRPLVIDPMVQVSAGFIGGSSTDYGFDVAVDASGSSYVVGVTRSAEASFPVKVGPDLKISSTWATEFDAFIAKVAPSGDSLVYAGYIGGDGSDRAAGVAVDATGAAYVTGYTGSTEETFPVVTGPDQTYNGGVRDAFIAKVAPSGDSLVYAGYIGGGGDDQAAAVAVDAAGAAYVTGGTDSTEVTFSVVTGPDQTYNGGVRDAFIAKVAPSGASLSYAGYIGGAGDDQATGVAVDAAGAAYAAGRTASDQGSFPVNVGPDLTYNGGFSDAFIAKVVPSGVSLSQAGYIGGVGGDQAAGVAVDSAGAAYVGGSTASDQGSFPVTVGPDLTHNGGSLDAFVAKIASSGISLSYAGYIGGSDVEEADDIDVDGSGAAYVVGYTRSSASTFPLDSWYDVTLDGPSDAFAAAVAPSGQALERSGFLGGSGDDEAGGVAVDPSGNIYVTGSTTAGDGSFPVAGDLDSSYNGGYADAFVAKFSEAAHLPDAMLKISDAVGFVGDDVYNATAAGQAVTKRVSAGRSVEATVRLQNDGTEDDALTLRGCSGKGSIKTVFSDGGLVVTDEVIVGAWTTGPLGSGAAKELSLKVKIGRSAKRGTRFACRMAATSGSDPAAADVVKVTLIVR